MPRSESPPPQKRRRQSDHENGTALPPLSLSILGVEPMDEFIKEIADWTHYTIMQRPPDLQGKVEVEAKVGLLRDKQTHERLKFPVLVETIIDPNFDGHRFESNMTISQHKHFNTRLNELKMSSTQPDFPSATPIEYRHLHLVDTFYPSDHPHDRDKIRVTRDEKTGNVVECMRKIRLGNLDISSPKRQADWRVSVNLEIPVAHPVGSPTHTRKKDRLSYIHEEFSIDLTQVHSTSSTAAPELTHELEIEITRPQLLLATAAKRNDPNASEVERFAFDELIRAFVNNARILVRNAAPDGWVGGV
ncbi:mRNA-capping enzyme subunit beta [Favolaschia claudopus]|uniref:mRNA-capping enzyme subunit beta n=1 Tax=Favolaschia claudopus TaxID=2862362 RepID=A0AAW0D6K8_9AGAR